MRKDIPDIPVENVAIAVVKELNDLGETEWNTYLINLRKRKIEGVLVTSTGYGEVNSQKVKTTTLRHFLDTVEANSYQKIEPIMENVFGLNNEYWLSFFDKKIMYDKKYIFLPESITEENLTTVPLMNKKGVMIL
jgi:hypothetical protein